MNRRRKSILARIAFVVSMLLSVATSVRLVGWLWAWATRDGAVAVFSRM